MRLLSALAVFAATVAIAACSNTTTTLEEVGGSPAGSVSPGLVSVPVGIVLALRATGSSAEVITTSIDDPSVATVAPTTQTSEFVVIGLAQGQTTLHVFAGSGEATEAIVQVTPQALPAAAPDASSPAPSGSAP
jgi:hypothetical protein